MKIKKYIYILLVVVLMSSATIFTGCFNVNTTQAQEYTIEVTNSNQGGSAYGSGKYAQGEKITIFAVADNGYEFDRWNDGNTNEIRQIIVQSNGSYLAMFKSKTTTHKKQYRLKKAEIFLSGASGFADDFWLEEFTVEDNQSYSFIDNTNGYTKLIDFGSYTDSFYEPHDSSQNGTLKKIVLCPAYNFVYDENEIANFRINLFVRAVSRTMGSYELSNGDLKYYYMYDFAGMVSCVNDVKQLNFSDTHYLELSYDNNDEAHNCKFVVSVKIFFDEF